MVRYKNVAVIFPGIGYHCEKPLLYYSKRVAAEYGYTVIEMNYSEPLKRAGADKGDLKRAFKMAMEYAQKQLDQVDWSQYRDVVFISKSIGSVVAQAADEQYGVKARHIIFTPVEETFLFNIERSLIIHGTADPLIKTSLVEQKCRKRDIPLNIVPNANHSLETGIVSNDLFILANVMKDVREWLDISIYN